MSYSSDPINPAGIDQKELGIKFFKSVSNDSQLPEIGNVVNLYNNADIPTRRMINEIFVHLCGFQLMTLVRTDPDLF